MEFCYLSHEKCLVFPIAFLSLKFFLRKNLPTIRKQKINNCLKFFIVIRFFEDNRCHLWLVF